MLGVVIQRDEGLTGRSLLSTLLIKKLGFGLHVGKVLCKKLMWQDLGANRELRFKCG